jgi:hypothetical protein
MKLFLLVAIASVLTAQKEPRPEDFPVSDIFNGTPAAPKFKTPGQRQYRTMIRNAAKKGPNFAGHYAVAEWGCGTRCVEIAVVDVESGNVYDGPFETMCLGGLMEGEETGIFYRRDGSLLILKGCLNEKDCGSYYYAWTGAQFKLVRKDPMKKLFGCVP